MDIWTNGKTNNECISFDKWIYEYEQYNLKEELTQPPQDEIEPLHPRSIQSTQPTSHST